MKRCVIIGGGVAGLSAASILSSKNISVTLLECAPKLGGRTYSFLDKQTNTIVDNGQHIMMGCYKDTMSFLKLIGAEDNFNYQNNLNLKLLNKSKKENLINADVLLYPLNLLYAIFNYNVLNTSEKINIISLLVKLPFISKRSIINLTVSNWMEKENQQANVIKYFWEILCVGALNISINKASAYVFYKILIQIFFKGNFASTIILPRFNLNKSIIEPAVSFIKMHNGNTISSETVKEIVTHNLSAVSIKSEKNYYSDFDYVISAVPAYALNKIIPLKNLDLMIELEYSTIINIHLWITLNNLGEEFYGLLDSPLHWIFSKENYLNVVISDADYLVERSTEEIFSFVINELAQFNSITKNEILNYKIIKEKRATFIPSVQSLNNRASSRTKIKNLFLAGDWIDTGLPSTIESAVKSGRLAAELVLNEINNQ